MAQSQVGIGVIGCGFISEIYLKNCLQFASLRVLACADLEPARAQARAVQFNIPRVYSVAELLADPEIDLVLNLTIPRAHAEVAFAAVRAGKSVYNEKPLTLDRAQGQQLLEEARAQEVLVGCAPDTFLGGGLQTCRQLIDDGAIGTPIGATAFLLNHGPENWHPDPDFYYQPGAGPMFDMGPYYLTALVTLMGAVKRVTGSTHINFPERTIGSMPKQGTQIMVNTPTHVAGVLDFASGAIGTIVTSFDVWASKTPLLEIYGSKGTLSLPDPNTFGGPVRLRQASSSEWVEMPLSHGYTENSRGIGVADMAYALQSGRPQRASGALAYHVLDIMHAIHDAAREGRHIMLDSQVERPEPLPADLPAWTLDA